MTSAEPARAAGLSVTGLVTGYNRQPTLHGVGLEVPRHSVVAVVGPNGAGKTTLINAVAGLLPTWRGTVSWDGAAFGRASPRARVARGVSVVPQGAPTFPKLSVIQNLLVAARVTSNSDVGERVADVLQLFPELASRPRVSASSLSGGQRQMLAIGRALCQRPSLLLIDEPSFGLAVGVRHRVVEVIKEFAVVRGGTVLIVEQDAHMVKNAADVAYFMTNGVLEEVGRG